MGDTANNYTPGFYRCDRWPHWFKVDDRGNAWGFSIYNDKPGYRTLGIPVAEWIGREMNSGIVISLDYDRTKDRVFIDEQRKLAREEEDAEKASEWTVGIGRVEPSECTCANCGVVTRHHVTVSVPRGQTVFCATCFNQIVGLLTGKDL